MKQGQYSWQYYHNENSWPIVHAFSINSTELNEHPVLKQKLQEIAGVEHNNHLRGGVINIKNESDSSWLVAAEKMGYRYAMIWLDGTWPASHDFNMACLEEIDRINAMGEWMVAGNIESIEERYAFFSRNVMIINIKTWREQGQPDPSEAIFNQGYWGLVSAHPEDTGDGVLEMMDIAKLKGALSNLYRGWWRNYRRGTRVYPVYEDSLYGIQSFGPVLTALWHHFNDPAEMTHDQFNQRIQGKFGTPLLTYSLRQNVNVPGISDTFMEKLTTIRPHIGSGQLEDAIQGSDYIEEEVSFQGNRVIKNMFAPDSPIYFVNTEPSQPQIAEQIAGSGFDQYVGATAGFKLFYYAQKYGFNLDTKFVLYDFDEMSCKFKRDMMTDWDGKNLPDFVDKWMIQHPNANGNLRNLTVERWPTVVDQFGGEGAWMETWQNIKNTDWKVIQTDLIYGHDELFKQLNNKRTFMWTSNIYSYIIPKMLSKPFALEQSFISLISQLNELDPDCWFSGTDINDNDLMCPSRAIISTTNNDSIGFEV
ncbi:hypothetical protein N8072_01075 [bacterium]|nr:hypothetical protein [bacterium]MDB4128623.1 hypothetical protein [bacterium]MDC1257253.1 hypothetical protein [bacterium]